MPNTTIDTLEVKITASAQNATSALKSLSTALNKVKTALTGVDKDGLKASDHIAKSLNEMNGALNTLSTNGIKKLQKLANGLNDYADAVKRVKGLDKNASVAQIIQETQDALGAASSEVVEEKMDLVKSGVFSSMAKSEELLKSGVFKSVVDAQKLKDSAEKVKEVGDETKKAGDKAKHAAGMFGRFIKSVFRIALYRAIRSALKAIGEAFSEGLKNAYMFSKQTEGFERLANTMDRIASVTAQMKNQLGAFWGEIKQSVLPVIEWLVEKVRAAAEWMTEFIAALRGEDYYLRARYVAKEWEEATDELMKYKHQLLGLDELNNLSKQQSNKKEPEDYTQLFDKLPVRQQWRDLHLAVDDLKLHIDNITPDWGDLTRYDVENILIVGLSALTGGLIGGVPGAIVGSLVGIALTLGLDYLNPAENGKQLSQLELFDVLYPALLGLTGGWIGFEIGKTTGGGIGKGIKGALIGMSIGATIGIVLNRLVESKSNVSASKDNLFTLISKALITITGGWIGFEISKMSGGGLGQNIKGALVGASIAATVGMVFSSLIESKAKQSGTKQTVFDMVVGALLTLTSGWVGFEIGKASGGNIASGIKGALVGMTIGSTLSMILQELYFANGTSHDKNYIGNQLIGSALVGATTGAMFGWKVSGVEGALVGAAIGLTLSLVVSYLLFSDASGENPQSLANKLVDVLLKSIPLSTSGALIGWSVGGAKGALIGLTIGISLTLLIQALGVDWGDYEGKNILGLPEILAPNGINRIDPNGGIDVQWNAAGGINQPGTLFYAGEAGPEFIGRMGNSSAVANTEQMTDAIYKAAYMGMSQALRENGGNGLAGFVPATTDDLFIAMRKKASNYNKATGSSAFA